MATQPEVLQNDSGAGTPRATPDTPRVSLKQWFQYATVVLIALNVLVFVIMVLQGVSAFNPTADSVLKWGADYGPLTLNGQWWRMIASTFLHFGLIHLLFNMYVLFNIGLFIESLAGRGLFVAVYLVCGVGGSAASLAWHPSTVSAGASGAIFGLYGVLLGYLLRHRGSIPAESLASLRKGAFTFIGYNLLFGLRPGIDMAAHLGGLATGFVLGLFLIRPPSASPSSSPGSGELTTSPAELTPDSNWRVPVAVAIGLALIAVPVTVLPKTDDYLAEYERLSSVEEKGLELFNASLKQWQEGKLTSEQYADILEKRVLPPWRAERETIEKLKVSGDQAARKRLLVEYLRDREEGWQLTVDGFRTHDAEIFRRAGQKADEAEKVAVQLRGR